jgi:hypothetical protein
MEFLKKHYEKILLGAVLLGLAGAVVFLFLKVETEKEEDAAHAQAVTNPKVTEYPKVPTAPVETLVKRTGTPVTMDLSAPHKVFNPLPWQKNGDQLEHFNSTSVGPMAVTVTKLNPLNTDLTLDTISVEGNVAQFLVTIKKEASSNARERMGHQTRCKVGDKNETFTVKGVNGPADNPTNLVVELNDTGEHVVLEKDKTFQRVDGYTADLKYPPDKAWSNRRVGTTLQLGLNNEEYKIVAINTNEIVLSAKSNDKKWTVPFNLK